MRAPASPQPSRAADARSAATRRETRRSEARSYAALARARAWFGALEAPPAPAALLLEERACDSFSNVLFALTLFRERVGAWPARLTLVSHGFKRARLAAHAAAVGFPAARTVFVGIDAPVVDAATAAGAREAERQWRDDPQGRGAALAGKRRARNVWGAWQGVFAPDAPDRGGLATEGEGAEERLVEGAPRPWMQP